MAQVVVVVVAPTKEERWREGGGGGEENEGDTGATSRQGPLWSLCLPSSSPLVSCRPFDLSSSSPSSHPLHYTQALREIEGYKEEED